MSAERVDRLRKSPLQAITVLAAICVLALGVTLFIPSPGITLSLSAKVSGLETRVASARLLLSDITASHIYAHPPDAPSQATASNNLLEAAPSSSATDPPVDEVRYDLALDTLSVPEGARLALQYRAREESLQILAESAGAEIEMSTVWRDPGSGDLTTKHRAGPEMAVTLIQPRSDQSAVQPFRMQALNLEEINATANTRYPVSRIEGGSLRFFVYGHALPGIELEPGVALRFAGLDAEMSAILMDEDGIALRLFGTAEDVQTGFGSAVSSVYPSLFSGLGSMPVVRVILSSIFALIVTLIGSAALFSGKTNPNTRDAPPVLPRANDPPQPADIETPVPDKALAADKPVASPQPPASHPNARPQ